MERLTVSEAYEVGEPVELVSTGLVGEVVRVDTGDILPFMVKFRCFTSFYEEKDLKGIVQRKPTV